MAQGLVQISLYLAQLFSLIAHGQTYNEIIQCKRDDTP